MLELVDIGEGQNSSSSSRAIPVRRWAECGEDEQVLHVWCQVLRAPSTRYDAIIPDSSP